MCGQVSLYSDRKQVLLEDGNIFDSQRVSAFGIFYHEPESGSYKKMIMENIWGIDSEFIDPNTISVMISRLKKKLNDSSNVISNVFGMGYRMEEYSMAVVKF